MELKEFETLINVVRNILLSLGVIAGGLWALFSFRALRETSYRRAQLAQLEANLRKTEREIRKIELANKKQAALVISIESQQVSLPDDPNRYISAVVSIENRGNRNARLPTASPPFTVRAVKIDGGDEFTFKEEQTYRARRASNPKEPPPNIIVRAGALETIPFFCQVKQAGLYLLTFRVAMSQQEQKVAEEEGFAAVGSWVAKEYLIVV